MITVDQWRVVSPIEFESLALEHVQDIYDKYKWHSTKAVGDDGKDGEAEIQKLNSRIKELYWMEAKHKPDQRSIGKYTLDTHLVSTLFSKDKVKRLHVVTSGRLSANFVVRANIFASEHNFEFAYSDAEVLEYWLATRTDVIKKFFRNKAGLIAREVETATTPNGILGRAFIIPEASSFEGNANSTNTLLPGLKYLLVVTFLRTRKVNTLKGTTLHWRPNPKFIYLLNNELNTERGLWLDNLSDKFIYVFPFRLIRYFGNELPSPFLQIDPQRNIPLPLKNVKVTPRLSSPFVGFNARELLIRSKQMLEDELSQSKPLLLIFKGKAGSGKSRLSDEILDEGQKLGFTTKTLKITSSNPASQAEYWRGFLRWIFGFEYNPFELVEEDLIEHQLEVHHIDSDGNSDFKNKLTDFLIKGVYHDDLFNLDFEVGKLMAKTLLSELTRRLTGPAIIHIEDAHRLSGKYMRPLYLFRHLIDTHSSLPLGIVITCRTDETVVDPAIKYFIDSVHGTSGPHVMVAELPEFDLEDAKELVSKTLQWPELQSSDSEVMKKIMECAGTNPFFLMQTLHHIAIDKKCVVFGYGEMGFLLDVAEFKKALKSIPAKTKNILNERFTGLRKTHGESLLQILFISALIGKEAPLNIIRSSYGEKVSSKDINLLLSLGYFAYSDNSRVVLAHDLLVETLLKCDEIKGAAVRFSKSIDKNSRLTKQLGSYRCAKIYFFAGKTYFKKSWNFIEQVMRPANERQEYLAVADAVSIADKIVLADPVRFKPTIDFQLIAAFADQHCGNTKSALDKFLKLRTITFKKLTDERELSVFVKSSIEAGNQHFLRAEPSSAKQLCDEVIRLLNSPKVLMAQRTKSDRLALAYNRLGAICQLIEEYTQAEKEYLLALTYSESAGDRYLYAHTLWNLGSLLRYLKPVESQDNFRLAREIWDTELREKERFRIMLDTSETYSSCLEQNDPFERGKLYTVASEAHEKGYVFQACGALICYAVCCFLNENWADATTALIDALNLSVLSEDIKTRLFVYHYLSVCSYINGDLTQALNYSWLAFESPAMSDGLFENTALKKIISVNYSILKGQREPGIHKSPLINKTGELYWYRFTGA